MIKCICDRCKKECKTLVFENIPYEKTEHSFKTRKVELCEECAKEYDRINSKLADIRMILVSDFMT